MSKDFRKKKERAGKKRPQADNYTNTAVKQSRLVVRQQRAIALGQAPDGGSSLAARSDFSASVAAAEEDAAVQSALAAQRRPGTTHRGLTLDDVLARLSHSSAATRQDAVHAVRELATDWPDTVAARLGLVLERLAPVVPDADRGVRAALRLALAAVLDARVAGAGAAGAAPFMPLLVAYVAAALTHALDAVRVDAVALAAVLLDRAPVLTRSYAPQLIASLGSLLASRTVRSAAGLAAHASTTLGTLGTFGVRPGSAPKGASSASSASASANAAAGATNERSGQSTAAAAKNSYASRTAALQGLTQFLCAVMRVDLRAQRRAASVTVPCADPVLWPSSLLDGANEEGENGDGMSSATTTATTRTAATATTTAVVLPPTRCVPRVFSAVQRAAVAGSDSLSPAHSLELLDQLYRGLEDVWAESVPFADDTAPAVRNVATVIDTLLAAVRPFRRTPGNNNNNNDNNDDDDDNDNDYFGNSTGSSDSGIVLDDAAQAMLARTAGALQRMLPAQFPVGAPSTNDKLLTHATATNVLVVSIVARVLPELAARDRAACSALLDDVVDYLVHAYRGYLASDVLVPATGCARLAAQHAALVARTLDALPALLAHASPAQRAALSAGFVQFFDACVPASAAKHAALAFLRRAVRARPTHGDTLAPGTADALVAQLPKLLWQLKTANLASTALALDTLLAATRALPPAATAPLQNSLVPFLFTILTPRATSASSGSNASGAEAAEAAARPRPFYGPFVDLPEPLQEKTLAFVSAFPALTPAMERALLACALSPRARPRTTGLVVEALERFHAAADPAFRAYARVCGTALALACAPATPPAPAAAVAQQLAASLARLGLADGPAYLRTVLAAAAARQPFPAPATPRVVGTVLRLLAPFVPSGTRAEGEWARFATSPEGALVVDALCRVSAAPAPRDAARNRAALLAVLRGIPALLAPVLARLGTLLAEPVGAGDGGSAGADAHAHLWTTLQCVVEEPHLRTPALLLAAAAETALRGVADTLHRAGMDTKYHQECATLANRIQMLYV